MILPKKDTIITPIRHTLVRTLKRSADVTNPQVRDEPRKPKYITRCLSERATAPLAGFSWRQKWRSDGEDVKGGDRLARRVDQSFVLLMNNRMVL